MGATMTTQADLSEGRAANISFLQSCGRGTSYPLVLLHGIGSNAESFAPLIRALPSTMNVIAWNAPGYGNSAPLENSRPSPEDYAAALERFLRALGLNRIALLGHSLGALFAASFAASYPAYVAALALVSPALGYNVANGAALPPEVEARITEIEKLGPAEFAARRSARLVARPVENPQIVAAVRRAMAAVNPSGYRQAVYALGAGNLLADAERICVPTLVIVGSDDVVTPPGNAESVRAKLPRMIGYAEIAGTGHACVQERPQEIARLISCLFEEVANV